MTCCHCENSIDPDEGFQRVRSARQSVGCIASARYIHNACIGSALMEAARPKAFHLREGRGRR